MKKFVATMLLAVTCAFGGQSVATTVNAAPAAHNTSAQALHWAQPESVHGSW